MITITAPLSPVTLRLGKQGENAARQIVFDVSGWVKLYGEGTVVLLHQRSGDSDPYPVTVEQDGDAVTWTVSNVDTGVAGKGAAELQYMVGDTLAKSVTYRTHVADALGEATDPPDAYETWLDTLTTLAAETQTNAEDAADSADSAAESAAAAAKSAEAAEKANTAEAARAEAEAERVEAESLRAEAEAARVSAETLRSEAEATRITAEEARVAAEAERVKAEEARVEAEQQREESSSAAVAAAEEATAAVLATTNYITFSVNADDLGLDVTIYEEDE